MFTVQQEPYFGVNKVPASHAYIPDPEAEDMATVCALPISGTGRPWHVHRYRPGEYAGDVTCRTCIAKLKRMGTL